MRVIHRPVRSQQLPPFGDHVSDESLVSNAQPTPADQFRLIPADFARRHNASREPVHLLARPLDSDQSHDTDRPAEVDKSMHSVSRYPSVCYLLY